MDVLNTIKRNVLRNIFKQFSNLNFTDVQRSGFLPLYQVVRKSFDLSVAKFCSACRRGHLNKTSYLIF